MNQKKTSRQHKKILLLKYEVSSKSSMSEDILQVYVVIIKIKVISHTNKTSTYLDCFLKEIKLIGCHKRYFIRENKQRAILCTSVNVFTTPLPFNTTQIIKSFLTSMISANHGKQLGFQPIVESLYSLMVLQYRISFDVTE